jgi:hypothetical protein
MLIQLDVHQPPHRLTGMVTLDLRPGSVSEGDDPQEWRTSLSRSILLFNRSNCYKTPIQYYCSSERGQF